MDSSSTFKPKSFWQKPEGTTGMIFAALGIVGGGLLLFKLLPFIVSLLSNLLYTVLLIIALAGIGYVIIDPRFRNLLAYGYKSIMQAITSVFVTIDPIGIIRNYVDKLRKQMENVEVQLQKVRGQIEYLQRQIAENDRLMKNNLQRAQVAQKEQRFALDAKLAVRKAGRLDQSNVSYKQLLVKLETLFRTLSKIKELGNFMVEDLNDEVEQKIKERKAILAGHSAIKSAMRIIKPEQDQKYLFDMAMESMAEDVSNKVGDIEYLVEASQSFMNGMDLQNGVFEEEGWKILERWESSDSSVLGDRKQTILMQSRSDAYPLDLDKPCDAEPEPRDKQFGKLFQ